MRAGVLAEYHDPEALLAAVTGLRERGYAMLDAFTPFPVPEVVDALGLRRSFANLLVFPIGLFGAAFAFGIQALVNAYLYRLDVGGRPPLATPAFIIIAFETMVLFSGVGSFILLMWLCRLPRLAHPLFGADGFTSATRDGFWLAVNAADPRFDPDATESELRAFGAQKVEWVG